MVALVRHDVRRVNILRDISEHIHERQRHYDIHVTIQSDDLAVLDHACPQTRALKVLDPLAENLNLGHEDIDPASEPYPVGYYGNRGLGLSRPCRRHEDGVTVLVHPDVHEIPRFLLIIPQRIAHASPLSLWITFIEKL